MMREEKIDLRLTRADHFADKDEGRHICKLFKSACDEAVNNGIIDDNYKEVLCSAIEAYLTNCDIVKNYYVFCFSKSESNQYLIDNYAKREQSAGIIIGLQALPIEDLLFNEATNYGVDLIDVLYDDISLKEYMILLIEKLYELRLQDNAFLDLTKSIVMNQLLIYGLAYKAKEYAAEEETRLIVDCTRIGMQSSPFSLDPDEKYLHLSLPLSAKYNLTVV